MKNNLLHKLVFNIVLIMQLKRKIAANVKSPFMSLPKNGTVGGPNIAILFKSTNDGKVLMQDFTNISPISNCHP